MANKSIFKGLFGGIAISLVASGAVYTAYQNYSVKPANTVISRNATENNLEDRIKHVHNGSSHTKQKYVQEQAYQNSLYNMIARHEGIRTTSYNDNLNVRTIGVGFNLERKDAREKIESLGLDYDKVFSGEQKISKEQAYLLMREDIKKSVLDVKKYIGNKFNNLPNAVKLVLIDMDYNMGYSRLSKFKNLKSDIINRDYSGSAYEMVNSKWYKQVGNRSKELTTIMRSVK